MSGINKVIIIGNLGNDPEIKTTTSGQMVAQLSIATSENYTDKSGQRQEKTEWHRVILWEKQAELAEKYLRKGSKLYVEGKLQTRSWEDTATGQKKYATEIIGRTIEFLDSKPQDTAPADASRGGYGAQRQQSQAQAPAQRQQAPQGQQGGGSEYFNDDIPF